MPLLPTSTPTKIPTYAGGVNLGIPGSTLPPSIPTGAVFPIQVMGYVPMYQCGVSDCRVLIDQCPHVNIVFGNVDSGSGKPDINSNYQNDWNTFHVDYNLYASNPNGTASWKLQKCVNESWSVVAVLNSNAYGVLEAIGSIPYHNTYTSYWINWGIVLKAFGAGYYRIKLETSFREDVLTCQASDPFWLRQFDCNLAHGTVKFETWSTGSKGSATAQGAIFNICNYKLYGSIRLKGFFGFLKPAEQLEVFLEHQNGRQKQVRNEQVRKFLLNTKLWPEIYHRRFSVYCNMADEILVSDYNLNNSNYDIKRIPVARPGLYEIEYHDKEFNRNPNANCEYKEGIQTIISSLCCSTTGRG